MTKTRLQLTPEMIEGQVVNDLIRFQRIIKKPIEWPIDLEFFVEKVWGVGVAFEEDIKVSGIDDEVVGCLSVKDKSIKINLGANGIEGRLNFTLSHEIGHVSLHSPIGFDLSTKSILDVIYCRDSRSYDKFSKEWQIEFEANTYASNLLLPKRVLFDQLGTDRAIDLDIEAGALMKQFGVSRQMLELRLHKLKFSTTNNMYNFK